MLFFIYVHSIHKVPSPEWYGRVCLFHVQYHPMDFDGFGNMFTPRVGREMSLGLCWFISTLHETLNKVYTIS
jgi:hypothetical protein